MSHSICFQWHSKLDRWTWNDMQFVLDWFTYAEDLAKESFHPQTQELVY